MSTSKTTGARTLGADIKSHPAAKLFPLMGKAELEKLAEDIAANGLLEPIGLYEGKVLDGRNRLSACRLAEVEPHFIEIELNGQEPYEYVLSRNLRRRQLTVVQLALLAFDIVPYYTEAALIRKRRGRGGMLPEEEASRGKTAEHVGEIVGVSSDTVRRMLAIHREDPEIIELMRRGAFESVRKASIAAGLIVSYSNPRLRPGGDDEWDETFTPVAAYLRGWLQNPPALTVADARARLRHLQLLRRGLDELEAQLREMTER